MYYHRLLVLALCCCLGFASASVRLSCTRENATSRRTLTVAIKRHTLAVYKYANTDLVNFELNDLSIKLHVETLPGNKPNGTSFARASLEGLALLENGAANLAHCDFFLKRSAGCGSGPLQDGLTREAHTCLRERLCPSLEPIRRDDLIRARILSYSLDETPKLCDSKRNLSLQVPDKVDELQVNYNILMDHWLASALNGILSDGGETLVLPNALEYIPYFYHSAYFKLSNGSLWNLRNTSRLHDVRVTKRSHKILLEAEFSLPIAKMSFRQFEFKAEDVLVNGSLEVHPRDVTFGVKITVNYLKNTCKAHVRDTSNDLGEIGYKVSTSNPIDKFTMNFALPRSCIETHTRAYVNFVETKLLQEFTRLLDSFDCELFKPI